MSSEGEINSNEDTSKKREVKEEDRCSIYNSDRSSIKYDILNAKGKLNLDSQYKNYVKN